MSYYTRQFTIKDIQPQILHFGRRLLIMLASIRNYDVALWVKVLFTVAHTDFILSTAEIGYIETPRNYAMWSIIREI